VQGELFAMEKMTPIEKAQDIIVGDREGTYGDPSKNFRVIAAFWQTYLDARQPGPLNAKDVCALMALLKTARFAHNTEYEDSVVDAIGYWSLVHHC
jgi:hypothetical protein